jgi:hypothetical protein
MSEPLPQDPVAEEPQPDDQQQTPNEVIVAMLDDDEWED